MDKERKEKTARVQDAEADGIIEGRNAVIEALRAGTTIDKIFIQKGETDKTLGHIASTARAAGVVVVDADKRKLDFMSRTHAHQGVIALTSVREYVSVEDILNIASSATRSPTRITLVRSSARRSARARMASSFPSAAARASRALSPRRARVR